MRKAYVKSICYLAIDMIVTYLAETKAMTIAIVNDSECREGIFRYHTQMLIAYASAEKTKYEVYIEEGIMALFHIVYMIYKGGDTNPPSPIMCRFRNLWYDVFNGQINPYRVINECGSMTDTPISVEEITAFMKLEKYSD
jgi:hypothetical protein